MIQKQGPETYEGTLHFVVTVGDEPVCIDFGPQVDDILISSPEGDVVVCWDTDGWQDEECLLIKTFDNLKELGNVRCTQFYLKSYVPGKSVKVFVTAQRN